MVNLADDNSSALIGTAIAFLTLTYVSVSLRTYVRARLTRNFQVDDGLMLVAQTLFTLSCTFIFLGVSVGLGKHDEALSQDAEIEASMWQSLATATYILNMMFIKLSYAIFLLRFAVQKRYRWTLWASTIVVTIWSTVLFFWDIFQCNPVRAQWDYTIPGEHCVGSSQVVSAAYALSVMTIATDFLYALLPIPMIWHVKMTKQAKATVIVLLGLGIFASVATLIRFKFLSDLNDTSDILYAGTDAMIWTLIEPGVAIVASSMATVRPLLHAMHITGFLSPDNSAAHRSRSRRRRHYPHTIGSLVRRPRRRDGSTPPGLGRFDVRLSDMEETGGGEEASPPNPPRPPSSPTKFERDRSAAVPPLGTAVVVVDAVLSSSAGRDVELGRGADKCEERVGRTQL